MPGTPREPLPPRQFHVRLPDEAANAVTERASLMGLSRDQWITRAVIQRTGTRQDQR